VVTAYFLATSLGHLEVSLWLVERRQSDWLGNYQLVDFLPWVGAALLACFLVWQAWRAVRGNELATTLSAWAIWLIAVALVDRTLIFSLPEYLHYPQYALLAWLLARFVDPDRTRWPFGPILLATTLLGIADEVLQYTWITTSYSNYLDFNDFLLNLLGGFAGLMAYYGFGRPPERPIVRRHAYQGSVGFAWLGVALLIYASTAHALTTPGQPLVGLEREISYGQWISGPHAGSYYVLPPALGTSLLLILGVGGSAVQLAHRRRRALGFP
jgi:hypothetical protein